MKAMTYYNREDDKFLSAVQADVIHRFRESQKNAGPRRGHRYDKAPLSGALEPDGQPSERTHLPIPSWAAGPSHRRKAILPHELHQVLKFAVEKNW